MTISGQRIVSTLAANGQLTVELAEHSWDPPKGSQVLVRIEATPINPSDLGLLFGSADTDNATYEPGQVVAQMPEPALRAMTARIGIAMPVGNEGAGKVVAAGDDPAAQALLGKRVACLPGGASYATHAKADASMCLPVSDDISSEQAASAFVNPLTALGFVETMRAEGYTGMVHSAAASNLGQMLIKICQEDGIPLVNIVRKPEQVALLKSIGAKHVIDSSEPGFVGQLTEAIGETGAMMGFDAVGGGKLAGQMLAAMEAAANKGAAYSRYGSSATKHVYIYGALDLSPTILNRNFGFQWDLSGWLLTPFLMKAGAETAGRMRQRVMDNITTTFASHYKAKVSLEGMLSREAVADYNARRTGEKYLVVPGE